MSYSRIDRYGDITTSYAHMRGGGPPGGTGGRTWWPDFGPGTHDFSAQRRSHPSDMIFEKVVAPKNWSSKEKAPPATGEALGCHFRNQDPARLAMLEVGTNVDRKLAAHIFTERQCAIRRLENRQLRMDSWAGDVPIRMVNACAPDAGAKPALGGSQSTPSLGISTLAAASASRDVYEKYGFPVGRHQGSIADGKSGGGEKKRRNIPLSMQAMLMSRDMGAGRSASTSRLRQGPRKPSGQWKQCPENSFVFDPRTFLPVPRGGWNNHDMSLTDWPEASNAGNREFSDKDAIGSAQSSTM
mmetsp:Transcript_69962/g.177561  ORF Transcript_69962/g.177561 Transcript_69962/m.177561 type:complete len:299 (+) Transcript_69962:112-1008(+)|eukprot:CAMPEP_0183437520 /NCGR_PEP_ID=MMETSP0370-20130417/73367_1 /TAXON_ID=268820 /ORGANISM="Peridinium aciculiferum, Strain PAER-2" /LENGTH=298 /DNA_ID=CAMNT_0025625347 /DNA_START=97 /DNA_END=993 /DNA_ORIENTATION=-